MSNKIVSLVAKQPEKVIALHDLLRDALNKLNNDESELDGADDVDFATIIINSKSSGVQMLPLIPTTWSEIMGTMELLKFMLYDSITAPP